MRRLPAAVAALGLAAVALVGCSSSPASSCDRTTSPGDLENLISVSGDVGTLPEVDVPAPFHAGEVHYTDVVTGDGPKLVDPNQVFEMGLTIIDGTTGESVGEVGYGDTASETSVMQWVQAIPGLEDPLQCASEGSRVVVGLPAEALGTAGSQLGLTEGSDAVAVLDLTKVNLSAADGADQFNEGRGLPTVVRAPSGQPGIIIPDAEAPTEPVVQVLKRGDGEKLENGDTALLAFTSVAWNTPTEVAGTTWGAAPQPVPIAEGDDAVISALRGQTVGSQVMIVLPTGGGDTDADAGADVYVFDILGAGETAAG